MVRAIPDVLMALENVHDHRRQIQVFGELNNSVGGTQILSKSDAEVLLRYIFLRGDLRCAPYENRMATGCLIVCLEKRDDLKNCRLSVDIYHSAYLRA